MKYKEAKKLCRKLFPGSLHWTPWPNTWMFEFSGTMGHVNGFRTQIHFESGSPVETKIYCVRGSVRNDILSFLF